MQQVLFFKKGNYIVSPFHRSQQSREMCFPLQRPRMLEVEATVGMLTFSCFVLESRPEQGWALTFQSACQAGSSIWPFYAAFVFCIRHEDGGRSLTHAGDGRTEMSLVVHETIGQSVLLCLRQGAWAL